MNQTHQEISMVLDEVREVLLNKNRRYGDSALNPKRIFSKAPLVESLLVRIDDKLSRIMSGQQDEDEDVELDLIGYLVLLKIARRRSAAGGVTQSVSSCRHD